jgi:tRNA (guanine10-N2)-methyltransferase
MQKYDLKTRLYLGPTTLDHFLSFIMANMAGVTAGDLCLDPFVGTASLLVPLAHHGAFCMGTDIDVRVIRGMMYAGSNRKEDAAVAKAQQNKTPQSAQGDEAAEEVRRDVFTTFGDYALPAPELLRLDLHSFAKHYHHSAHGMFDAIVTDPPYGIRAGGRKSGKASGVVYEISKERRHDHIPVTQNYGVEEVMLDLLDCSATLLKVGGALCYLIPTPFDFAPEDLPQHPCFDMEQLCLQQLSTRHGRHAVLLRKQRPYTEERKAEFGEYKQKVLAGEEGHFDMLAKKLEEALAPAARENETVIIRSSKKAAKRRQAAYERRQRREEGAGAWKGEKGVEGGKV